MSSDVSGKVELHGTTVLCVRRDGKTVIAADGQVSFNNTVLKATSRKVRRLHDGRILAGFAGSTADALTLFERFEAKLQAHSGQLTRAAVEMAKDWRTDRALRKLEAMLLVADNRTTLLLTGNGDVIEPDGQVIAIGSGGSFARAAAEALVAHSQLSAREIAESSMRIAADICIYTNHNIVVEELA